MGIKLDIKGQVFGRWTVVELSHQTDTYRNYWLCRCSCGNLGKVAVSKLTTGASKSCGCYAKDVHTTHGMCKNTAYSSYMSMMERCSYTSHPQYHRYGGRGIKVCERWRDSLESFILDMGERPSFNHSIDRVDGDGDYEPSNCRWATRLEQSQNRKTNKLNKDKVMVARTLSRWGLSSKLLGRMFNANRRTIEDALNFKTWRNV